MPDIFDEVEEDLRAERARKLAQKWGGVALAVAVLALGATGAWQGWRWYEARQAATAAETYLTLHRATEREGADLANGANGFAALSREAPGGYRTLARLRAAALKAETGDLPAALALWGEVAGDRDADPLYRDLATLLSVTHAIETGDPAQLAARIAPLTAEGNPWRASAREAQALLAIRRGAGEEARRILEALVADTSAPQGVRERAQRVAAGLRS
ncbi:tetratricopeptide repeat protein [Falsiroseomonas oryzae]|uniref:tetratricopeptide repeat protein n=1 Tax=Falsiroseomonas oryzae TaxID=2766473 RepID=UPI0022EB2002|nr:tetratricopeptide repeat protein [Roseomonas sp. MO-31]